MRNSFIKIAALVVLFTFNVTVAQAGFINLTNTSGNEWNIQFSPITLTMKSNPGSTNLDWLVFEDFFATTSTNKGTEIGQQTIWIAINGGISNSFNIQSSLGIHTGAGGIDANDLFINIAQDTASASAGDTITVSQNGAGVDFSANGVPAVNSAWNGQVAFWATSGQMVTENTFIIPDVISAIPEPAVLAILGLGLVSIGFSRRAAK
jgi:hypothetical protein